ncbi:MAG TPA: hypothetical protein VFF55_08950 [Candidatus Deferrimicrobium sp.]|nr:hypothetical protein [Candidatus Deferrimicrobium sp.]
MTPTPEVRRERPLGVAVIAVFMVFDAIVALATLAFDSPLMTRTSTLLKINEAMPAVVFAVAVLRLIAALGLWLGWRRAWPLTMLLVGTGLLFSLYLYAVGDPPYARLAIDIVIAFYLNQGIVRDYFEGRPGQASVAAGPPGAPASRDLRPDEADHEGTGS